MLKEIISSIRDSISNYISTFKERLGNRNAPSELAVLLKLLNGRIERSVFKPNPKSKGKKRTEEAQQIAVNNEPIGLVTAPRPETSPLHESTLRVSSRKYRSHLGIADVMDKALNEKDEELRDD